MISEPIKFLLVDDTADNLVALEALLRREGLELLEARSGAAALELCLVHDIALALIDVQMPGMSGFELAELMRGTERTKHVPIVFITAGPRDPHGVFKGYETGAVDFLFKPIEPHVLKNKADVFFELSRQRRELARELWLSEMFVGILGHDLRNPLGAIVTGAQVLERVVTDPSHVDLLHRMVGAGRRMSEMVDQLLDLTRARLADGLGFAQKRAEVDLGEVVRRTADELRVAHPGRELVIRVAGDCTTSGDPDRLLQVFSNLLANALDHGAAGSAVTVALDGGERQITVHVHNRGNIPPETLPTIFDPFQRRSGSSPKGGLGLGLFIARQIAVAHGGDITVRSSAATGTSFTVLLPRRSTPADAT